MPSDGEQCQPKVSPRIAVAQFVSVCAALWVIIPVEVARFFGEETGGWIEGLVEFNLDTTAYALLVLILPLFWLPRKAVLHRSPRWFLSLRDWLACGPTADRAKRDSWFSVFVAVVLVAGISIGMSLRIASWDLGTNGVSFGSLPPAYHDEYSYLFQAKTFLAGRCSFPAHPDVPRLFDQMHVLNEDGRFASRYFPGVGAWIAPFLAFGAPVWGHIIAGALIAVLVFAAGRELANNGVGLLAGLLVAVSPGMGLFSNLLLSHHPTLVGLALFLFAFVRFQRTLGWGDASLAGLGLSYSMLCRPMTAAGFGLPFGIWLAAWLLRGGKQDSPIPLPTRLRSVVAMGISIVIGFSILLWYNREVTGDAWTTPYQVYTDTYTPRHVYGFDNVVRGEQRLGPKVLENYDRWAKNLTPSLALENSQNRLIASSQWTLGIVPFLAAAIVFLLASSSVDRRWWLLAAAIVCLHAVHVPYWYDGIMHYHYVFETGVLCCLLFAVATCILFQHWQRVQRFWMPVWWSALIVVAILINQVTVAPFWSMCRISAAINEVAFSRLKYRAFNDIIASTEVDKPALVIVIPDPADRHIDFVVNDPSLDADVLLARFQPNMNVETLQAFPNRALYLYSVQDGRLLQLAR